VKVVATWNELGAIGIWDAETGERRTTLGGHTGSISDAKWSPDGERLATASTDATTRLWAPEKIGQVVYLGHLECRKPRIVAVQLSPSGSDQVVTAGVNGCAHVWRASDGARLAVLTSASIEAGPADARFSPKGDLIAVTQARVATPLLFTTSDLRAAVTLATPPRRDDEPMVDPQQIRWSPDGSRVAVKQSKGLVVWSATSGAIERVIVSARPTMSMCWNPTGDRLALALWTRGDAVEIWDAAGDAPPRVRLGGYADGIWSVDWSADGRHVATACNTAIACVHDAESGARLTTREHGAAVKVVALSPDGRWLATGDDAKALTVWEWAVEGSLPANGPSAHGSRIAQITWSADSSRLVSMSEDGLVCLWERRGSGAGTRFVHVATVRNTHCRNEVVASSPDGKWLVTGDDEGAAMIHPVAMDDLVEAVRRRLGRSALTDAEWTQYLPRRRPPQAATTKG
jgi:WD40 repeat protein